MFSRLISLVVIRPVTTMMVTVALIVFGWVAATRLPVELLPNLSYPSITIRTNYPDAAPAEVEELVSRPIEELVGSVPGIVSVESVSREGQSELVLDFAWGTSIDGAMAEVREKLDRVRLPTTAERPIVLRFDPSQEAIMRYALAQDENLPDGEKALDFSELRTFADQNIKRALEKVPGVAAVVLNGGDEEEIRVELKAERLAALQVPASDVVSAIRADNINRPGGGLTTRGERYLLRTVHEAKAAADLEDVVLRSQNGAHLRLREVADISRGPVEREQVSLIDGREAIEISIFREGDANTVAVSNAVQKEMQAQNLGKSLHLKLLSNQADFISAAVREVIENTIVGGILAVLVLLFFLRQARPTAVIAAAIPISLLVAFVPLAALGVSLNLMSLGGLALGVGMLVDNSIVVLESIARVREQEPKLGRRESAVLGTQRVASSVVASTLTTIAVFFPMAFVEGVAGQLVRDLSYAVSLSIASSMMVSLTLVPVLQGAERRPEFDDPELVEAAVRRSKIAWLTWIVAFPLRLLAQFFHILAKFLSVVSWPLTRLMEAIENAYPKVLRPLLRLRYLVILGSIYLCYAAVEKSQTLGRTLLPSVHQGEFFVQIRLPTGTSLQRTRAITQRLMGELSDTPEVDFVFARVGSITQAASATGNLSAQHLGQVNIRLHQDERPPWWTEPSQLWAEDPGREAAAIEAKIFEKLSALDLDPNLELRLGRPELFAFDPPIEVQVLSDDLDAARARATELKSALSEIPEIRDLVSDELGGRPELRVQFQREKLSYLGLTVDDAAAAIQRAVQGELAGFLHAPDKQLDIRVQLPRVDRSQVEDVRRIRIGVVQGIPIILSAIADVEVLEGPAEIRRMNGRRGLRLSANTTSSDLGAVAAKVQSTLDQPSKVQSTSEIDSELSGQATDMSSSLESLAYTTLLSLFLVYVVMASSFESLHHPLLIMGTVPLAATGVIAACLITGTEISAMVGIGGIILGGIVVNNAIVLIHAINQQRGAGESIDNAILNAGHLRLRPILMTTATTILGLLPMALGVGEGAALRQSLAIAIIGGLSVSAFLTLFVIPSAYRIAPGRRREAWEVEANAEAEIRRSTPS